MKPLIILLATTVITLLIHKMIQGGYDYLQAGRIGMSAMLLFTAIGHFAFTKGMEMMLPQAIPYKKGLVYFTGIIEIWAAIGLLIPRFTVLTGWLLIIFFVCILPANIYAALRGIDYQKETYDGPGKTYLWFRVPLQILFIVWVYVVAVNR